MKKCLVVIDYQKDFVDGALPCGQMAMDIENSIYNKIVQYKSNDHHIVFTLDTHNQDYKNTTEGKIFPEHCVQNTDGWKLYGKIGRVSDNLMTYPKSIRLSKSTYGSKSMCDVIRSNSYDEVEFVGVATNICVLHNVIMFYNMSPETKITVDASCCASFDKNLHDQALDMMAGFGVNIINREDV